MELKCRSMEHKSGGMNKTNTFEFLSFLWDMQRYQVILNVDKSECMLLSGK